jgi:hypothetical protein
MSEKKLPWEIQDLPVGYPARPVAHKLYADGVRSEVASDDDVLMWEHIQRLTTMNADLTKQLEEAKVQASTPARRR